MARPVASCLSPVLLLALGAALAPAASAERKSPAPIEYVDMGQGPSYKQNRAQSASRAVPRPNTSASRDPWRGPVTRTGSVSLPNQREQINFSYPGANAPAASAPAQQYASVEETPRASLPKKPERLWPAEATASPLDASKAPAIQTLTLGEMAPARRKPAMTSGPVAPKAAKVSHEERGLASWYGEAFDGKPTANGEIFDMEAMTAAHRTLPLPSLVQVINEETGKEIVVRVNDRGPFTGGRIIDLSRKAASTLGIVEQGEAPVVVRYLGPAPAMPGQQFASAETAAGVLPQPASADKASRRMSRPDLYGEMLLGGVEPNLGVPDPGKDVPTPARLASAPEATNDIVPANVREESLAPVQPYNPAPAPPYAPPVRTIRASATPSQAPARNAFTQQIYVQIGAFADIGNAQGRHAQVGGMFPVKVEDVDMHGADYFRVMVGPFPTRDAAERARVQLRTRGVDESFVTLR
ncbi:septal ring lytic transglycosylase RlpA family protein [Henriciella sp.]|uniref:septal ring lytic transglycosylase RlpA family protein n=1 Tax=Henriciella sp. TaxID=1968823 RepID=UPI00262E1823|nr:septal ring lytic transglycosylase RlpA family protein [Henriciella sp.]